MKALAGRLFLATPLAARFDGGGLLQWMWMPTSSRLRLVRHGHRARVDWALSSRAGHFSCQRDATRNRCLQCAAGAMAMVSPWFG